MKVKNIKDEDFLQYKLPSMFIGFPKCSFKCGNSYCQNYVLRDTREIPIECKQIVNRYLRNDITHAIVFGGLEPFDTPEDCLALVSCFREKTLDTIVIYTGYTEQEIEKEKWFEELIKKKNIIIKFGRYLPNQEKHYDEILGIELASNNQYAKFFK